MTKFISIFIHWFNCFFFFRAKSTLQCWIGPSFFVSSGNDYDPNSSISHNSFPRGLRAQPGFKSSCSTFFGRIWTKQKHWGIGTSFGITSHPSAPNCPPLFALGPCNGHLPNLYFKCVHKFGSTSNGIQNIGNNVHSTICRLSIDPNTWSGLHNFAFYLNIISLI